MREHDIDRIDDRSIDLVADIFSSNCLTIDEHKMFLKGDQRIMKKLESTSCILRKSDAFKNYYPAKLIDKHVEWNLQKSSPYVETAITSGLIR